MISAPYIMMIRRTHLIFALVHEHLFVLLFPLIRGLPSLHEPGWNGCWKGCCEMEASWRHRLNIQNQQLLSSRPFPGSVRSFPGTVLLL